MSDQLTLEHVRAAHARIRDSIVATPTLRSQTLSKLTGANIYLKFENHQFTAAYKETQPHKVWAEEEEEEGEGGEGG